MNLNVVMLIFMIAYLGVQTFFDVFNKCRVPLSVGYIGLSGSFLYYLFQCVRTGILSGIRLGVFVTLFVITIGIYLYCKKKNIYVKGASTPGENYTISQQLFNYSPFVILLTTMICSIDITMGITCLVIWILSELKIFGHGDRTAFWAISFYFATFAVDIPQTNTMLLLILLFISEFVFLVRHKAWTHTKDIERRAFFPYILLGFIITVLIGGLSYGRI